MPIEQYDLQPWFMDISSPALGIFPISRFYLDIIIISIIGIHASGQLATSMKCNQ